VHLGDRIAILEEGGVLAQYDTPATILGAPASSFVADFVGADRGLKRLSVTGIAEADLERPPVVRTEDTLAEARRQLGAQAARWAVVLDADGHLHGWLGRDRSEGEGLVRERARRMDAWVPVTATLKTAFGQMLTEDAGWIAVLDGDQYLGVLTPESLHAALRRSIAEDVVDSPA
jgi:osmoprotectant transport system ATP-binding protein